jgi:hypothetical protein
MGYELNICTNITLLLLNITVEWLAHSLQIRGVFFGIRFRLGDRYPEFCRPHVSIRAYLQDVFQLVTNYRINRYCTVRATNTIVNKKFWDAVVEVILRPTVSRPVCLGVRHPSGTRDQFFFLLEISCRQLRVCYFVAPSLTRGRVCNLLYNCFWALPEQSLLGRSPSDLWPYFTALLETPPNLESQVPVFISPRNRVAQLYLRALGSLFVAYYDSQGYREAVIFCFPLILH